MRKTIVYVDGFNLYYALKRANAKWLDLPALCARLLTENDIVAIKYFTARVKSRVGDLDIHILRVSEQSDRSFRSIPTGQFGRSRPWISEQSDRLSTHDLGS